MVNLIPMQFENAAIRVVDVDGEPWFVAVDICGALGHSNATMAVAALDDDERAKFNLGRQGDATIINESGLYTLILRSRDATTPGSVPHRIRKWVTAEVLPSIRKTGAYAIKPVVTLQIIAPEFQAGCELAHIAGLKGNQARLAGAKAVNRLHGVNPLALIGAEHLVAEDQVRHFTPTELGKRIGMSGQK